MPDFAVLSDLFSAVSDLLGGFSTFVGSAGPEGFGTTLLGSATAGE
ncbi:hypothetical protein [Rhodococcus sp. IEGM 1408]|nr:hypothetical protein [Rhodococcus sp. IEGM 1408]MDV8001598.1 hypothetical protein [Rhodococcus sp. IEGM 1408]